MAWAWFYLVQAETNIPTVAEYVMVTEFETGRVLMEKGKDLPMEPASMAKIMTSYVVFSRIKDAFGYGDQIIVSEKAWKMGGSRSFLKPGTRYSVKELLYGVIVQSGNDAAVAWQKGWQVQKKISPRNESDRPKTRHEKHEFLPMPQAGQTQT